MLHIIILNKNYFPSKLNNVKPSDRVVILASPDGSIPVSAYKDEVIKNMEVKLLPDMKDISSAEGKNALRIAQAVSVGQLTASEKDFEIYTDDNVLLKAIAPFTGKKAPARKKTKPAKGISATNKADIKTVTQTDVAEVKVKGTKKEEKSGKSTGATKSGKVTRADVTTKPARLPSQAEVKRVLGAANSGYAKPIMEVIKKSNQITFEMDLRMKLVEAGMEAPQCQELAKTINEEFGKMLPASM